VPPIGTPVTTTPTVVTSPGGSTGTTPATPSGATTPGDTSVPATTTPSAATPEVTTDSPGASRSPWLVVAVVAALAVLVVAACLGFVLTAKARRRARRRTAAPNDAVLGAWEEALDHLHDARVPTDAALTPLELGRRISPAAPGANRPLRDLARAYTATRYGTLDATPDDAARAWEAVDAFSDALDAEITWRERWRRRFDPSTLMTSSNVRRRR
jgi:hypothetical protein